MCFKIKNDLESRGLQKPHDLIQVEPLHPRSAAIGNPAPFRVRKPAIVFHLILGYPSITIRPPTGRCSSNAATSKRVTSSGAFMSDP